MTLRILSHRIGLVVLCSILGILLLLGAVDCAKSHQTDEVSQLQKALVRTQSFSFGDSGALFHAPVPGVEPRVSFDDLPSGCPDGLPVYKGAQFIYGQVVNWGNGADCSAVWDSDDTTDDILAYYKEAFSKSPWSVAAVQPTKEDGSGWLQFHGPGVHQGLVGVGPVEGSNTIALNVWFGGDNSSE